MIAFCERRLHGVDAILVDSGRIGASLQQQAAYVCMATGGREYERGPAFVIRGVHVSAEADVQLNGRPDACQHRHSEHRCQALALQECLISHAQASCLSGSVAVTVSLLSSIPR